MQILVIIIAECTFSDCVYIEMFESNLCQCINLIYSFFLNFWNALFQFVILMHVFASVQGAIIIFFFF